MAETEETRAIRAEVEALRRELADMHAEQREMARSLEQLSQTFRSLALHLGIASEPYRPKAQREPELQGFG